MTGNSRLHFSIKQLALPFDRGGYKVANIPVYCDLFYMQSIFFYCRHRANDTPPHPDWPRSSRISDYSFPINSNYGCATLTPTLSVQLPSTNMP